MDLVAAARNLIKQQVKLLGDQGVVFGDNELLLVFLRDDQCIGGPKRLGEYLRSR